MIKGVFCYVNEATSRKHLDNRDEGWLSGEPNLGLEGWNFESHSLGLWRRGEILEVESTVKGQWFNQSWLGNEASINTKNGLGWELLRWWALGNVGEEVCLEGRQLLSPDLALCISSIWLLPSYFTYTKLVKIRVHCLIGKFTLRMFVEALCQDVYSLLLSVFLLGAYNWQTSCP